VTAAKNYQPDENNTTKKLTKIEIKIFINCSFTETKKIVPIGIVSIIAKNIGDISLNLQLLAPT
jgi:hypothetical protein